MNLKPGYYTTPRVLFRRGKGAFVLPLPESCPPPEIRLANFFTHFNSCHDNISTNNVVIKMTVTNKF